MKCYIISCKDDAIMIAKVGGKSKPVCMNHYHKLRERMERRKKR